MSQAEDPMHSALKPLVAICGATGVGKSKLAIELALSLSLAQASVSHQHGYRGARIINADAMQVYQGMDIITNKVSAEEMHGVEHLLMSFKQPGEQYLVTDWVRDAMKAIDETHRRRQVPIVVGGTSYWIQHLLFPNRLVSVDYSHPSQPQQPSERLAKSLGSLPTELLDLYHALPARPPSAATDPELASSMHCLLSAVDPTVAQRFHWRDTRKAIRQLNIIKEFGRPYSEILAEQDLGDPRPRYRSLLFWLHAKPDVLKPRLNLRVDQMVEEGLLDEIRSLRAHLSACSIGDRGASAMKLGQDADSDSETESVDMDYTLGVYQSIGYKEFHDYLNGPHDEAAFQMSLEKMKTATRQYAKRQTKWILYQLLPSARKANAYSQSKDGADVVPAYVLDATELGRSWDVNVREMAIRIADAFLNKENLPDPVTLSETARELLSVDHKREEPRKVVCQVCTINEARPVSINEGEQWAIHARTRTHRKRLRRLKMLEITQRGVKNNIGDRQSDGSDESEVALCEAWPLFS